MYTKKCKKCTPKSDDFGGISYSCTISEEIHRKSIKILWNSTVNSASTFFVNLHFFPVLNISLLIFTNAILFRLANQLKDERNEEPLQVQYKYIWYEATANEYTEDFIIDFGASTHCDLQTLWVRNARFNYKVLKNTTRYQWHSLRQHCHCTRHPCHQSSWWEKLRILRSGTGAVTTALHAHSTRKRSAVTTALHFTRLHEPRPCEIPVF